MNNLSKPDCIRTYTGKDVNVFKPERDMFCIEDVAWALSKEQRFGNHLKKNYCVAQHCLICSEMAPPEQKLTALMHEATEPYLRDICSPQKKHEKFSGYREVEDNLMNFLSDIFGFQYPLPQRVKEIDEFMFQREWNALMLGNEPFNHVLLSKNQARIKFLQAYKKLRNQ